jgi:hypothetical protein
LTHCAHEELSEHLFSIEAAHAFSDGIRERDIRRQLLFGGNKTLSEAFSQALELEAADIAAEAPSRVRNTTARTFWKIQPLLPRRNEETTENFSAGAVGAAASFGRTGTTNPMKKTTTDTGFGTTDAGGTNGSPREETNGY